MSLKELADTLIALKGLLGCPMNRTCPQVAKHVDKAFELVLRLVEEEKTAIKWILDDCQFDDTDSEPELEPEAQEKISSE